MRMNGYEYIQGTCRNCGKERNIRVVKGIPISDLCQRCSVRSPEYRAKMAEKARQTHREAMATR